MINVTKTFLPCQEEYQSILKRAWDKGWLTNRGVLVEELENKLKDYLNVAHVIATTNGTLPLQIAIKTLELTGDIITTPFSYVATISSIVWEGCTPVFVDIHPNFLTIDESKIEGAITDKTTAILATHVFGNPCEVETIQRLAEKHNLAVIYDAAHCFGVTYKEASIFSFGDISTCSFHATKLFHTGEGGAMFANDVLQHERLFNHHNFGHDGPEAFHGLGINAKMSELQAALGLAVFPYIPFILNARKSVCEQYNALLCDTELQFLEIRANTVWNYSYFPVIFRDEAQLLKVKEALNKRNIFPRRYFYPSLDELPYVSTKACEISRKVASCILCLPLYVGLKDGDIKNIVTIIKTKLC